MRTCLIWMNFDLQIRYCVEMQLKCKLCQGPWVVRMEVKWKRNAEIKDRGHTLEIFILPVLTSFLNIMCNKCISQIKVYWEFLDKKAHLVSFLFILLDCLVELSQKRNCLYPTVKEFYVTPKFSHDPLPKVRERYYSSVFSFVQEISLWT